MRKLISVVAAAAFLASTTIALADDNKPAGAPLAPGGAAGVHAAQLEFGPLGLLTVTGLAALTVGTIIVLSNNNGKGNTSTTTTTTTP